MAADSGEDARVGRTRADVARAALGVLTSEGSDAVTHARVAEVAGYSKTTLYAHWPARFDLIAVALDGLGDMPHHERSGDLRADLVGELTGLPSSRGRVPAGPRVVGDGPMGLGRGDGPDQGHDQHRGPTAAAHHARGMLQGLELEAAVSMLAGVVACPSIMFGTLPDDAAIGAAVDIVLRSVVDRA